MAKQIIDLGTVANDGTGDPLRDGGDKINDNFTELYNVTGWANYQDGESSPATQTFTSTPAKLQIDGLGSASESGYLPYEIRGSGELWDTTNDKITPINIGDSYELRVQFEVTAETSNPNDIISQLDIGGGASPTIVIATRYASTGKGTPYSVNFAFPIFSLTTFVTNGGQIFISTDTGNVTVGARSIFLARISSGAI